MKPSYLLLVLFAMNLIFWRALSDKEKEANEKRGNIVYCAPSFDPDKMNSEDAPLFSGLGKLHYSITTNSSKAQKFFNQGLTLIYAFNHGEAGRSFKAAIKLDSTCAMAYWGLAMVLGPNYNAALNPASLDEINTNINKAVRYADAASPKEKALIYALRKRFPEQEVKDMAPYNAAYALALEQAFKAFPADAEIAVLYADALMNEHPWNLWLKDGTPQPWTPAIVKLLEDLLAKYPGHPGANHLYIHAMEASRKAAKALPAASRLKDMLPAAGHLLHMPSHIYIRTGNYHDGVLANEKASQADSNYVAQCKVQGIYPMMYYPHNIHFLAACAYLEGNSKKAIDAAWSVARHADRRYIRENAAIQHYSVIPFYVLVQTGKWNEILALQKPEEGLIYPEAIWHYARGMAHASSGNISEAKIELAAIKETGKNEGLKSLLIWETNSAADLVQIALNVLSGEIAAKEGRYDRAEELLRKAIAIEDGLTYQEPPDWFFSVRHTLGHILLQAKKYEAAATIYTQDMVVYPENGYALMGLYQSMLGQGKKDEAAKIKSRFDKSWKWADMQITSSRIY